MLTDLKHLFSLNALEPAYCDAPSTKSADAQPMRFVERKPGLQEIGQDPGPIGEREFIRNEFAFDNEGPRHRVFVETHALADRLVTNDEYQAFIEDDGYLRPELWLDDGWSTLRREGWHHPLYWRRADDSWREFTLAGGRPLVGSEPVSHISFFEADAYARWKGARLPTEAEWEVAASALPIKGNFVDSRRFHPASADEAEDFSQLFGDLWEWTSSAYLPYPGFTPRSGDLAEYNGKFMCNQQVLRGGSCVSSVNHLRPSYRNFFHAPDRWQFTGIRLAKEF
jgi:ergothioneine biosynthesis protein EgtB